MALNNYKLNYKQKNKCESEKTFGNVHRNIIRQQTKKYMSKHYTKVRESKNRETESSQITRNYDRS